MAAGGATRRAAAAACRGGLNPGRAAGHYVGRRRADRRGGNHGSDASHPRRRRTRCGARSRRSPPSPSGCDQFKWPIAHEQAALTAPAAGPLAPGAALPADAGARLKLVPFAEAKLALRAGAAAQVLAELRRRVRPRRPAAPAVLQGHAVGERPGSTSSRAANSSSRSASPTRPAARTRARALKFRLAAERRRPLQLSGAGDPGARRSSSRPTSPAGPWRGTAAPASLNARRS